MAIRATEIFCSGQGAMAEAPNLEGILAPLLLRVARLEAHFTTMDLPFVEDRLDNMETVVAALGREFDALAQALLGAPCWTVVSIPSGWVFRVGLSTQNAQVRQDLIQKF